MKEPRDTFRSLGELASAKIKMVDPRPFVAWDTGALQRDIIDHVVANSALSNEWIHGRLVELRRDKVHREDITIAQHGIRTVVCVQGKPRFSIKIKSTLTEE